MRLSEVRSAVVDALRLQNGDEQAPDYVLSVYAGNVLKGANEPLWGWLIGPPGCGKTELVMTFSGCAYSVFLSSLTESGLVSGYTDEDVKDPSLLPLLDGKILVVKDFTAVLSLNERILTRVMGDLRDAYDGSYAKASGRAGLRNYNSRFGFLAAVTPLIEAYQDHFQQLGERMLSFRMSDCASSIDERVAQLKHVRSIMRIKGEWRRKLREAVSGLIASAVAKGLDIQSVSIPEDVETRLIHLADLVARLRTRYHEKLAVPAESGSRILQQFVHLGSAHAILDDRTAWNSDDELLVARVACDTIPLVGRRVVSALLQIGNASSRALSKRIRISAAVINPWLSHYTKLGILSDVDGIYSITEDTRSQLAVCEPILSFLERKEQCKLNR